MHISEEFTSKWQKMNRRSNATKTAYRSFLLNKLVRDKVFENIVALGQKPHYKELTGEELIKVLKEKLLEESNEFVAGSENSLEELADLMEVIESLSTEYGSSFETLRKIQLNRRQKKGGFEKGHYIGQLDVPEGDKWADYYAAEPERFPEITNKN